MAVTIQGTKTGANISTRMARAFSIICQMFGISVDFSQADGFKIVIESPDGIGANIRVIPYGTGRENTVKVDGTTQPTVPLKVNPVSAALTAGVNATIAMTNAAGDILDVRLVTEAGTPAFDYKVERVDNNNVKVTALRNDGTTTETGSTSTVEVMNLGQV